MPGLFNVGDGIQGFLRARQVIFLYVPRPPSSFEIHFSFVYSGEPTTVSYQLKLAQAGPGTRRNPEGDP